MTAVASDIIAGLLTAFTAAASTDPTFRVYDGDPVDPPRRFLCIAWDESDDPVVSATVANQNLALTGGLESFDVANLLTVWAGDKSPRQVRDEAFTWFVTFRSALAADRTLGGVAEQALIASYEYAPSIRPEGRLAQIRFTVTASAFVLE